MSVVSFSNIATRLDRPGTLSATASSKPSQKTGSGELILRRPGVPTSRLIRYLGRLIMAPALACFYGRFRTKHLFTLLRVLCDAVEHYGKPRDIRTDNEAVFTSRLFRFGLWLLGIQHQRTEKYCPWMTCRDALMSWKAGCRERRMEGLSDFLALLKGWQEI